MSVECDIARLALHKANLQAQLDDVRHEIKVLTAQCDDLPFAVEIDGQIITVRKGQKPYYSSPETKLISPVITIIPKKETCEL